MCERVCGCVGVCVRARVHVFNMILDLPQARLIPLATC